MPRPSPWNSLEVTKVVLGALTPILLFLLGYTVNESIRSHERAAAEAESRQTRAEAREIAVQSLSRFIYGRRARAEMLASALRRNASLDEITERKRLYDEAYVTWNTNHQANLLLVRQLLGDRQYSDFESLMEFHLVRDIFAPLDRCLTTAYDQRVAGRPATATLDQCSAALLLQRALDCGYAMTDELFKLSGGDPDAGARGVATQTIASQCGVAAAPSRREGN
jgi:hypothetical protein